MDSIKYLKEKLQQISTLGMTITARSDAFCCIGIDWRGITLAYLRKINGKAELQILETVPCDQNNPIIELWSLVKKHELEGVNCSWVLNPSQYQLLVHDELPVKDEEFQSAVRWQIRKLLPFSIDDAYIDSFVIPPAQITNPKKMIMIVAAQRSIIHPLALQISESGLNLTNIDIQELALRNITALYEKDDTTTALLYLREKASELVITRQKLFYFSRHLDWNFDFLTKSVVDQDSINGYLDKLSLEIQRSFDYFHSQWRIPAPSRVLIASLNPEILDVASYLSQRLKVQASNIDLNLMISSKMKLTRAQEFQYLPVIGGVIKDEIDYATAD
jgi:Tfp pilus assembly PilM family ATPase